jgi:hypothetical protein
VQVIHQTPERHEDFDRQDPRRGRAHPRQSAAVAWPGFDPSDKHNGRLCDLTRTLGTRPLAPRLRECRQTPDRGF